MKVYISGPMTGVKDYNRQAFKAAEEKIKAMGYEVVNPCKLDHSGNGKWEEYMRTDIKALMDCDAIYMLKGWEDSNGAIIELKLALDLKFGLIHET